MDAELEAIVNGAKMAYDAPTVEIQYSEDGKRHSMMVSQATIDDAIRLRTESKSIRQIAQVLGVTNSIAWNMIQTGMKQHNAEPTDVLRQLEIQKLDNLEQAVLTVLMVNSESEDTNGQMRALQAVDRLIKLSETKRKLLGLDSPTVVETKPIELRLNGVDISDV